MPNRFAVRADRKHNGTLEDVGELVLHNTDFLPRDILSRIEIGLGFVLKFALHDPSVDVRHSSIEAVHPAPASPENEDRIRFRRFLEALRIACPDAILDADVKHVQEMAEMFRVIYTMAQKK